MINYSLNTWYELMQGSMHFNNYGSKYIKIDNLTSRYVFGHVAKSKWIWNIIDWAMLFLEWLCQKIWTGLYNVIIFKASIGATLVVLIFRLSLSLLRYRIESPFVTTGVSSWDQTLVVVTQTHTQSVTTVGPRLLGWVKKEWVMIDTIVWVIPFIFHSFFLSSAQPIK